MLSWRPHGHVPGIVGGREALAGTVSRMEALVLIFWLVVPLLFLAGVYWVVRIGVRDGMHDAERER